MAMQWLDAPECQRKSAYVYAQGLCMYQGGEDAGACECSYSLAQGLNTVNNPRAIKVTRCDAQCLQFIHREHHLNITRSTNTPTSLTLIAVRSCTFQSFSLALPQLVREQFGLLRLFLQKHHLLLELFHMLLRTTLPLARTVGGGTHESANGTYIRIEERRTRRICEVEGM